MVSTNRIPKLFKRSHAYISVFSNSIMHESNEINHNCH